MKKDVKLRALLATDWETVVQIFQEGIVTKLATFRTQVPTWSAWDQGHLEHSRIVSLVEGQVVGWAALSPVSSRPAYRGVAEVSIYVSTQILGAGIGSRLLAQLIAESEQAGIWTLQSTVFPENEGSMRLHKKFGFRVVGYREKISRVDNIWRDTVLLERRSRVVEGLI
jgi:phosphinothricin acetyltransferase